MDEWGWITPYMGVIARNLEGEENTSAIFAYSRNLHRYIPRVNFAWEEMDWLPQYHSLLVLQRERGTVKRGFSLRSILQGGPKKGRTVLGRTWEEPGKNSLRSEETVSYAEHVKILSSMWYFPLDSLNRTYFSAPCVFSCLCFCTLHPSWCEYTHYL